LQYWQYFNINNPGPVLEYETYSDLQMTL